LAAHKAEWIIAKINDVAVAITGETRDQVPLFGLERLAQRSALLHGSVVWRRGVDGIGGRART
jgi:hypothetical protein